MPDQELVGLLNRQRALPQLVLLTPHKEVMGTFNQGCGNYQVPLTLSPAQITDPQHVDLKCEIITY